MKKRFDDFGREIMDPKPVAIPAHFKRPPSLQEQMRSLLRQEMAKYAHDTGHESFDEADDFDVGDEDQDLHFESQYEEVFEGNLVEDFAHELAKKSPPPPKRNDPPEEDIDEGDRPRRRKKVVSKKPRVDHEDDDFED